MQEGKTPHSPRGVALKSQSPLSPPFSLVAALEHGVPVSRPPLPTPAEKILGATQTSIERRVDKQTVVSSHNGIPPATKMNELPVQYPGRIPQTPGVREAR